MMDAGLTFAIFPEGESLSLTVFQKAVKDVGRLIADVDYAVTGEKGDRRWVISELHSSVPTITLRPLIANDETVEAVISGINVVTKGSVEPPDHFTEQVLQDLRRMRRLFRGRDRARHIEFSQNGGEKIVLWKDIGEKVERILAGGYSELGTIEGTLEAINLHGTPTFTVWDRVSRSPVRCRFPEELKQKVKDLLEERVLLSGKVHYFANGAPRAITDVQDLGSVATASGQEIATFGSIPWCETSRDTVELLHVLREGKG